jgi:hypothetical protein
VHRPTHFHITNRSPRRRTRRTLWVIGPEVVGYRSQARSSLRGDHIDRALWSARAGSRGLSGKGRKSQRSSNPASQRYVSLGSTTFICPGLP